VNFDRKKFESQLPKAFHPVLDELLHFGFIPTLVGGSVRDFFMTGKLGKDWDVELSHETIAFNKNQWKELGKALSKFGRITFLSYDIIRLDMDQFQMEFSPPRIETFIEDVHHHSNFTVDFDFKLSFKESIKRRDFTLNAMGIRFKSKKEWEFLDPSQGLQHLRDKMLHPVGKDFEKDPVRFLRAVRFSLKYGLSYSSELRKIMAGMKLHDLSGAYFWSEMQKSGNPLDFLERMMKEGESHPELRLPIESSQIPRLKEVQKYLASPERQESWLIALEWADISCEGWRAFFSLSSDTCRRLARWAQSSKTFQVVLPEAFHGEFEEVRDKENFEKLFDWYFTTKQLLQKNPDLPLMKMIEDYLPEWIHLYRFGPPKDVKHIDPPFRAKYQVWNLCQRI